MDFTGSELYGFSALIAAPFVGSFLGVVICRLPKGEPILLSRSRCRSCESALVARDLVPVLSWISSKGRCRHCGAKISVFYPAIELAAFIVALWAFLIVPNWLVWPSCILGWTLLTLSIIDARNLILPDRLTIPLVVAGLGMAWLMTEGNFWMHAVAACAGYLAFLSVAGIYRLLRGRDGLGGGDAKLLAASGAWVSLPGLPSIILIAAAIALAWTMLARRHTAPVTSFTRVPFGPFLALATWLVWLHGPLLFTWMPW